VTGLCNELENFGRVRPDQIAPLVKAFRSRLDENGLSDVKLIATEASSVGSAMFTMVQNIMADKEACDMLDGWGFHSYGCSLNFKFRDMVSGTGKPLWQTESSTDQWATVEGGDNSGQIAGNNGVRILADLNLGTTHWFYFIDARNGSDGTALVHTDGALNLQYVYQLQICKTIRAGSGVRFCEADKALPRVEMSWECGQKPAIVAAAAVNPDGTWGIGLCNGTGIPGKTANNTYYPAAAYDVTLHVEELEDRDEVAFKQTRSNKSVRIDDEGTVLMRNGELTVTLNSIDLVCLRSVESVGVRSEVRKRSTSEEPFLLAGPGEIRINAPGMSGVHLVDLRGRTTRRVRLRAGSSPLRLGAIPAGTYVAMVETDRGAFHRSVCVLSAKSLGNEAGSGVQKAGWAIRM